MKTLCSLLLTFAAIFFLSGCTVHKDFTFSLDKELDVNNFPSTSYTRSDTVDASKSGSDYAKYKADITAIEVQSATFTVLSSTGTPTQKVISGTVAVTSTDGVTTKTLATVSDVTLQSVIGVAQPLTLTPDGKQFLQNQLLGSSSSAIVTFSGTTNEAPITFAVNLHFNLKATYSKTLP